MADDTTAAEGLERDKRLERVIDDAAPLQAHLSKQEVEFIAKNIIADGYRPAPTPPGGGEEEAGVSYFDYSKTRVIDRRGPIEHELKTWTVPYRAVESGVKPFEFRKNDRDYREGDTLWLRETNAGGEEYTGRELRCTITYCLLGGQFGVPLGYAVLGLSAPSPGAPTREDLLAVQRLLDLARKQWGTCKELRDADAILARLQPGRPGEEERLREAVNRLRAYIAEFRARSAWAPVYYQSGLAHCDDIDAVLATLRFAEHGQP